jgi:hypothetical protein
LKIDGHQYSPTLYLRILHMASVIDGFETAATALQVVGELSVSSRQINKLVDEAGTAMAQQRDARTQQYVEAPLPRVATPAEMPLDLAAVFGDGGRMRTRTPDHGSGVHLPHWRETKNASFHRMQSQSFDEDPQAALPDCFCNAAYVEKLVKGLNNVRKEGREEDVASPDEREAPGREVLATPLSWQPETRFRTCLSSLAGSDDFGAMMAAEADARGFFTAPKKAFVGDGQSYNWTIQRRWFREFVPIADFVHVVEYLYSAAQAVSTDPKARWRQYLEWTEACWQGRVGDVLDAMRVWQIAIGLPPAHEELVETDPRKVLQKSLTYLTNNRSRMDYPGYRRQGLPTTSSLAESLVKQVSKRVKGTEKFWNDGVSGEAILQLRAAVISDEDRLAKWVQNRPVSAFSPRCRTPSLATTT